MGCVVIFEFRVKLGQAAAMHSWLRENLRDTRAFEGFQTLVATTNQEDADNVVVIEQWDSRRHYESYIDWRTQRGDIETVVSMIEGEPTIRFLDYLGV